MGWPNREWPKPPSNRTEIRLFIGPYRNTVKINTTMHASGES
jgi:hypothetical protein